MSQYFQAHSFHQASVYHHGQLCREYGLCVSFRVVCVAMCVPAQLCESRSVDLSHRKEECNKVVEMTSQLHKPAFLQELQLVVLTFV